jgi:hypothetical protein
LMAVRQLVRHRRRQDPKDRPTSPELCSWKNTRIIPQRPYSANGPEYRTEAFGKLPKFSLARPPTFGILWKNKRIIWAYKK